MCHSDLVHKENILGSAFIWQSCSKLKRILVSSHEPPPYWQSRNSTAARTGGSERSGFIPCSAFPQLCDLGGLFNLFQDIFSSIRWGRNQIQRMHIRILTLQDFFGGLVDGTLPANAGGHQFNPWSGKITHVMEQLSPSTTASEPMLQSPRAINYWACVQQLLKPRTYRRTLQQQKLPEWQKACAPRQRPSATKNKLS